MADKSDEEHQLEWIQLKEQVTQRAHSNEEPMGSRFLKKCKENPLVPIGITATTFCLTYGLICMRRGDSRRQQLMMRGRVMAQGFTVFAMISGIMFSLAGRDKDKAKQI